MPDEKKRITFNVKNPVKSRAGKLGNRARWRNALAKDRLLQEIRWASGHEVHWRYLLRAAMLRYVLLRRASGSLRKKLGPRAIREYHDVCRAAGIGPKTAAALAKAVSRDRLPEFDKPLLAIHWKAETLDWWLGVTPEERKEMENRNPKQPRIGKRILNRAILLDDIDRAERSLKARNQPISAHAVYIEIGKRKRRNGEKAPAYATVRRAFGPRPRR